MDLKILMIAVLVFAGCAGIKTTGNTGQGGCPKILTESDIVDFPKGYCDNDHYRIAAEGIPTVKIKDVQKLKESSRKNAILNAQYNMIEDLKGKYMTGACCYDEPDEVIAERVKLQKEIYEAIKTGTVIFIKWDDTLKCRIIYEVSKPGLKRMAQISFQN